MGNGSVAAANSESRRVGGAGGKSDVDLPSARNSGGYGLDVVGVGTGKQGRKRKQLAVSAVGIEKVVVSKSPRVSTRETGGSNSAVLAISRGGGAAKNPESLVGGVVLAGIDIDEQLRLALLEGNKKRRESGDHQRR